MTTTAHQSLLATLALVVAGAQAWDAGALGAAAGIQLLTAVGVALPAIGILASRSAGVRFAMVVSAVIVLVTARLLSAVPLPELALAAAFPGILVLLDHFRTLAIPSPGPR